jgi:hypothetical protein
MFESYIKNFSLCCVPVIFTAVVKFRSYRWTALCYVGFRIFCDHSYWLEIRSVFSYHPMAVIGLSNVTSSALCIFHPGRWRQHIYVKHWCAYTYTTHIMIWIWNSTLYVRVFLSFFTCSIEFRVMKMCNLNFVVYSHL